jgi:hypothetical protein
VLQHRGLVEHRDQHADFRLGELGAGQQPQRRGTECGS